MITNYSLKGCWKNMLSRCYNQRNRQFDDYGGRGITVCDEWRNSREAFIQWALTHDYKPGLTIERCNNNGEYSPANCKWATRIEQQNNTRQNACYWYNGERKTIMQWAKKFGLTFGCLRARINRDGHPYNSILPSLIFIKARWSYYRFGDERLYIAQAARKFGLTTGCLHTRIRRNGFQQESQLPRWIYAPTPRTSTQ